MPLPIDGTANNTRETWLVGDNPWSREDRHHHRVIQFFRSPSVREAEAQARAIRVDQIANSVPEAFDSPGLKGDGDWMKAGKATPLTSCSCANCGGAFQAKQGTYFCQHCNFTIDEDASCIHFDADWKATLKADVPRNVPRPGKVADKLKCQVCGALGHHHCVRNQNHELFDSPGNRTAVGFADRGRRRFHPVWHSPYHTLGWTSQDAIAARSQQPHTPQMLGIEGQDHQMASSFSKSGMDGRFSMDSNRDSSRPRSKNGNTSNNQKTHMVAQGRSDHSHVNSPRASPSHKSNASMSLQTERDRRWEAKREAFLDKKSAIDLDKPKAQGLTERERRWEKGRADFFHRQAESLGHS